MGVAHGKMRDHHHVQGRREIECNKSASVEQSRHTEQRGRRSELHEESGDLIRPHKPLNPLTASKSHQELHKELCMAHKRGRASQEGKSELQRALERRRWEQRVRASRDQEEAKRSESPLRLELLRRRQRLEKLERDKGQLRDGPEFLRVKERLRRTAATDGGEKDVRLL